MKQNYVAKKSLGYYEQFLHNDGMNKEMYNSEIELIYDVDACKWYAFKYGEGCIGHYFTIHYDRFSSLIDALDAGIAVWEFFR